MHVQERRRPGYSSARRRVGRWLAVGSLNLSELLRSRLPSGRFDDIGDGDAGEDDGNGGDRPRMVNESERGKF